MGCYTVITIKNDGLENLLHDGGEFSKKLHEAIKKGNVTFGHGSYGNLVKVERSIHGSQSAFYVFEGGQLYEMSPYSDDTREIMEKHPELFKTMLDYMEYNVKELKSAFKKYEASTRRKK